MTSIPFAWPGFRGEAAAHLAGEDLPAAALRLFDPAAATATLHWGRNYIYRATLATALGETAVAVKQFRERSLRARLLRARGQSKAAKSFRMASAFVAAGLSTPEPLFFAEAIAGAPTAIFVTACLEGRLELRYLLRARNAGTDRESFPRIAAAAAIAAVARYARRMHDAGFFHRDFSIGNLLLQEGNTADEVADVAVLDLNRCRHQRRVGTSERMRDLCRLPLERQADREALLAAYFAPAAVPGVARRSYELARRSFLGKNRAKTRLRGALAKVKMWLVPRGVHAHIPPPPEHAEVRDRAVWDRLSDQPHQHAGRLARARIRITDLPQHLRAGAALAGALPRIRRRYRELAAQESAAVAPFAWPEPAVALRPWPENPGALLAAFDRLGARRAMIRLHPWQMTHDAEWELARALAGRGVELAFTLPQNRDLVRDPARWEAAIADLASRFAPLGRRFQIGQAINRSKWGIWNYDEYLGLAARAAGVLRGAVAAGAGADVELFGPAVIDFEAHVTAAVVNMRAPADLPALRFDGLASLLYVDRRGAPENRQLGFDTVDKVRLLAAIAGTARLVKSPRQWISEVNWPLREGPHSPAGKSVAVDEAAQADFLVRFYLLAAGSGRVERIDWWQLIARGYGLCDSQVDGTLRERPSFRALATLIRELAGTTCHGPLPASALPAAGRAYRFTRGAEEIVVAWSTAEAIDGPRVSAPAGRAAAAERAEPAEPYRIVDRDGDELPLTAESRRWCPSPRYFFSAVR
ncbi:MAG: hypothetical protein QG573_835 [Acidobacteriota bacterium]|nr:hypothetical protein [Acidobacteriota bacterium]